MFVVLNGYRFESPDLTPLYFLFLWGWMMGEVSKRVMDTPDELLARILDAAARINPLNAELNPICHLLALLEFTIFFTLAG